MIAILNAELGNIKSVQNSLNFLSIPNEIITNLDNFEDRYQRLILPGVGAFNSAMSKNKIGQFVDQIKNINSKNIPILGICIGAQILCYSGNEGGKVSGLGLLDGEVDKIKTTNRLPHIGWNSIDIKKNHPIFYNIKNHFSGYFVHSFKMNIKSENQIFGLTNYDQDFPSIVINKNVIGIQFHPEKSQKNGLQILKNFSEFNVS